MTVPAAVIPFQKPFASATGPSGPGRREKGRDKSEDPLFAPIFAPAGLQVCIHRPAEVYFYNSPGFHRVRQIRVPMRGCRIVFYTLLPILQRNAYQKLIPLPLHAPDYVFL